MISIEEFAGDFFQDVLNEADAIGQLNETIFFEKFCNFLVDSGDLETADRADYRGPPNSGVRVDGYGGDPLDASGTLSLIICDFNQSDVLGRLILSEINAIFQRLYKFLEKARDEKWRNTLEETSPAFGLADMIIQRWHRITQIRMILISNRMLSDRVDGRPSDDIDGKAVTYNVWDIGRLHRFAIKNVDREDIEIDLINDFDNPLPLLPAHLSTEEYESYLAVVPGELLASIYGRWGARLLEQNVRVYLQARGNVNKGIRSSLKHSPSMFFAYNNGITATAESVCTKKINDQLVLTNLKNFQIVNGGQTTASIHMAKRDKFDLSSVFVQMKLSIVNPEKTEVIVPKISEYANSQNRVNAADFFANHPFHVRMENFSRRIYAPTKDGTFRQTKWFYERARGQFNDARSKLTPSQRKKFDQGHPRSQLFSKTDLAKFLNVWEHKPDRVSLGAQKNFAEFAQSIGVEWKKNEKNFNETYFKEVVAKAIVFKSTEKIVSNQPWYEGGYRANIVAYSIAKLAHDVARKNRAVNFLKIWNKQSISIEMEKFIAQIARKVHDVLIATPVGLRNVTEWAKKQACWERVKNTDVDWPSSFLDDLISLKEYEKLKGDGRKDQKILNGIEAQTAVVEAGESFWKKVIDWGLREEILLERDIGVLRSATNLKFGKIPTEKQAISIMRIYSRVREEGFDSDLPSPNSQ